MRCQSGGYSSVTKTFFDCVDEATVCKIHTDWSNSVFYFCWRHFHMVTGPQDHPDYRWVAVNHLTEHLFAVLRTADVQPDRRHLPWG